MSCWHCNPTEFYIELLVYSNKLLSRITNVDLMDLIMYTYLYYIRIFLQIFSLRSIMHASSPVFLTLPSLYIIGPISSYSIYTISQHKKCRINKKKEHQRWNLKQLTKKNVLLMRHPIHKKKKKKWVRTKTRSNETWYLCVSIYIYTHCCVCIGLHYQMPPPRHGE